MDNDKKYANLDQYQMANRTFDDSKDAVRVTVVDGLNIKADSINIPELKLPEQKVIEVPVIVKEFEKVEVPVIVKELERVEVPVVLKEFVKVEVPVLVPEIKIIEVEKPVIIKETEIKVVELKISETPLLAKICMVVQALALIGILLTKAL